MTPAQIKALIWLGLFLAGLSSGWGIRAYIAEHDAQKAQIAELEADKQEFADYISKTEERDRKIAELNATLTVLDSESSRKLHESTTKNARLAGDLAVAERMQLKGASCLKRPTAGQTPGTSSVVDVAEIFLGPETRRAVFELRGDLISDGAKVDYLQDYIRSLGLSPPLQLVPE